MSNSSSTPADSDGSNARSAAIPASPGGKPSADKTTSVAPICLLVLDLDGRITFAAGTGLRCLGYCAEELVGRQLLEFHGHSDVFADALRRALAGENVVGAAQFGDLHFETRLTPIRDASGQLTEIIGVLTDMTEGDVTKRALAESQRSYATLLSNLPGMVYRCQKHRDWTMLFVSEGCTELTGYRPVELINNATIAYGEVIHPEDRHAVWDGVQEAVTNRRSFQLTYRINTAAGQEKWVWEQGRGVFNPSGDLLAIEGFITDISDRKRAEEEKSRLEAQLYQVQKLEAIGQFAGGVAHDFNNLLAVIMGNASLTLKDISLSPKTRESLSDILNAAERGSALTHQLLAYARGGLQEPTPTDINSLIRVLTSLLERTAPAGMVFDLDLAADAPMVLTDPPRIEQVVMNLCLNAIQASSPPAHIAVVTRQVTLDPCRANDLRMSPGKCFCMQVIDQGCGIPIKIRDKIFEPFFTTKQMGRGMGLSGSLGIVQSHHGQISVESEVGKGTTISVYLPATDRTDPAIRPAKPVVKVDRPPRGSETILIVDDEISVRDAMEQMLSTLGYCVVTHADAEHAIAFLDHNAEDIDLVLCDLNLPGHNGWELAGHVAEIASDIVVLLTTGEDIETLAAQPPQAPIAGFIQKPFTLMTLAKTVRDSLDRRSSTS